MPLHLFKKPGLWKHEMGCSGTQVFQTWVQKTKAAAVGSWEMVLDVALNRRYMDNTYLLHLYQREKQLTKKEGILRVYISWKAQRQRGTADRMETNIDTPDDDKPILEVPKSVICSSKFCCIVVSYCWIKVFFKELICLDRYSINLFCFLYQGIKLIPVLKHNLVIAM